MKLARPVKNILLGLIIGSQLVFLSSCSTTKETIEPAVLSDEVREVYNLLESGNENLPSENNLLRIRGGEDNIETIITVKESNGKTWKEIANFGTTFKNNSLLSIYTYNSAEGFVLNIKDSLGNSKEFFLVDYLGDSHSSEIINSSIDLSDQETAIYSFLLADQNNVSLSLNKIATQEPQNDKELIVLIRLK